MCVRVRVCVCGPFAFLTHFAILFFAFYISGLIKGQHCFLCFSVLFLLALFPAVPLYQVLDIGFCFVLFFLFSLFLSLRRLSRSFSVGVASFASLFLRNTYDYFFLFACYCLELL